MVTFAWILVITVVGTLATLLFASFVQEMFDKE